METSKAVMEPKADEPKTETSKAVMEPNTETSEAVIKPKAETSEAVMEPKADTSKAVMEPNTETSEPVMEPKADKSKPVVVKKKHSAPHSFTWTTSDKRIPTTATCNVAGSVEDSLRKSFRFRKVEEKMKKNKELVLLRGGKVITSHFPCSLIQEGENLTVEYVKAPQKLMRPPVQSVYARSPDQYVVFNILPKGKKNIVKILRNTAIESLAQELTVYALKGEKVKHALKRDGRFQKTMFEKTCGLEDISTNAITEMSSLVDYLDGKAFQIILLDKSRPTDSQPDSLPDSQSENLPDSQPGSLDDTCTIQSKSPNDLKENWDPSLSPAPAGTKKPKLKGCAVDDMSVTKEMRELLCSQLENWVKTVMKRKAKQNVPKLLRAEFGKNCDTSFEVKRTKTLMHLSDSVCQFRVNGAPVGSGFLLFDTFVLTNAHVLKKCCVPFKWELYGEVTVHFSFESLDQPSTGQKVMEVVGLEYGPDVSGYMRDWALLSVRPSKMLPNGLMTHFGFCPPGGNIYIIGHPDDGVKKIDSCWIIPVNKRTEAVDLYENTHPCDERNEDECNKAAQFLTLQDEPNRPVQFLTHTFIEKTKRETESDSQILTYNTCFYFSSSGSPVFDSRCKVVAMHSAGYGYKTRDGRDESVIEIGYPLSLIIKRMMIQLEQRQNLDVLRGLKKFFESKAENQSKPENQPEPMDCS